MTDALEIVELFEKLMSQKLSVEAEKEVSFRFNRKGHIFKTEIALAKQLLIEADNNLEMIIGAIEILFKSPKYSWRINGSILNLRPIISVGISIWKSIKQKEKLEEERRNRFKHILDQRDVYQ